MDDKIFFKRKSFWLKSLYSFAGILIFVIILDYFVIPWYVRLGEEVELPDVVEMTRAEAEVKLTNDGFNVLIADSVYNAHYPAGTIVEQLPAPFSVVKQGRHVYLTVSVGEKPIIMPNLFYKSPRDAELLLQGAGLKLKTKLYEYSEISLAGVVISQSFPAGQVIKKDTPITISVSLGPFPKIKTIPYLIGKSLDAARKQLRLLGISNIDIVYRERDNILPETVLSQEPEKGSEINDSTHVTLEISKVKNIEE